MIQGYSSIPHTSWKSTQEEDEQLIFSKDQVSVIVNTYAKHFSKE